MQESIINTSNPESTWNTELNKFQKSGLLALGIPTAGDFSQQINSLNEGLAALTKGLPEGMTPEETKKALALNAVLEATKLFFAKLNLLVEELEKETNPSSKIEIMQEIINTCAKYKDKLDAVSALSDPDRYQWQLAVVVITTMLVELMVRLVLLYLISSCFTAPSPVAIGLVLAAYLMNFTGNTVGTMMRVNDIRNLSQDSNAALTSSTDNVPVEEENKSFSLFNYFAQLVLDVRRYLFGDFGLFLRERSRGFNAADSLEEMVEKQKSDLSWKVLAADISDFTNSARDGFDSVGSSFSSFFSDVPDVERAPQTVLGVSNPEQSKS